MAVRTRSYDRRYGGLSDDILDRHIFDPVLHDQFVTVGEPYFTVDDFEIVGTSNKGGGVKPSLSMKLASPVSKIEVELHYELDGVIRRKWADIKNVSPDPILLLDVHLDMLRWMARLPREGMAIPSPSTIRFLWRSSTRRDLIAGTKPQSRPRTFRVDI